MEESFEDMEKIKRFFECLVPVTACNLKCSYCYIIQRDRRKSEIPKLKYDVRHIGYSLRKERLGGTCFFSICGAGETLMADHIVELVEELLRQGHYVNITTNGTLTGQFERLAGMAEEYISRLHVSFSLHYLELQRIGKLDAFFDNANRIKSSGGSILVQFNLCDEYEPYLNEIRRLCVERMGAAPQVAPARREVNLESDIRLFTGHTWEEYYDMGKQFGSPLFEFNMRNFNVQRKEFCYAGDWSGVLDLNSGVLRKCYAHGLGRMNIFENPGDKINFGAVGKCGSPYCMNSSHFLSLGVIPELYGEDTYGGLRNRNPGGVNWQNDVMKNVLGQKLSASNKQYSGKKKFFLFCKSSVYLWAKHCKRKLVQKVQSLRG